MSSAGSATVIPVFKLYGETRTWPTPDLLHCESIAERSRLHDWEIRPHRHSDLVQVLYVQAGDAFLDVEGRRVAISEACVQVVPALSIHGFGFSEDVQGHVLSLALPLVEGLQQQTGLWALSQAGCYRVGEAGAQVDALFAAIAEEYRDQAPGREVMLQSLISQLLVWIGRRALAQPDLDSSAAADKGRLHVQRFNQLVEAHYREHWTVEAYAAALGLSAAHLNALCRRLAGVSALQLINQRLLLEAKRNLVYTTLTVYQVADSLGFSEPAYFSRFFKRATGMTPKAFRGQR